MNFISWHYTYAVNYYIARFRNLLLSINHQFSLTVIPFTLFSPWKRLVSVKNRKGFNPAKDFEEMSFNFVSRGIGFVVRFCVFFAGLLFLIITFIAGFVGFIFWLTIPFLSLSLYQTYMNQPEIIVKKMLSRKVARNTLKNSDPGIFLLLHLGNLDNSFYEAFPEDITVTDKGISMFGDLTKNIFENNTIDENKLRSLGVSKEDVIVCAHWWDERRSAKTKLNLSPTFHKPGIGLSLLFGYTPILDKYCVDMGEPREFTHHLIGREDTVSRVERILTSGTGVILTGVPGVGKKTVVYEFARRAYEGLLGKNMSYKRILDFDYNAVISGSLDTSSKKELLSAILTEAENAGNIILLVRDIHRITNSSVEALDFTDILTSHLENKKLLIISIIDSSDYDRYVARNDRLKKFFEVVPVTEIPKEEALDVLLSAARYSEKRRGIITPVPLVRKILSASDAYLTDTPFPEKCLELLDEVLIYHETNNSKSRFVELQELEKVLTEKTGIALTALNQSDKAKLTNIEQTIHEKLISQNYPISLIAKALRARASGVVDNARPVGSFLFLGPTGVGKTETAKVLAEIYFGSANKIVRFDMSEFAGGEGLERLIGSANRGMPGELTTAIKNNPSTLLLLDEIEKAPPQVFNLFLSLLDEGKITDAFGKSISCAHVFVVATSNAGSEYIRNVVQEVNSKEELQKKVLDKVLEEKIFSPEFLNRFDGVVVYEPLSRDDLKNIAKLQLNKLSNDLKAKGIKVEFTESVLEKVATEGYDPALGARPMRRMIELTLGDFIANAFLKGEIKEGDRVTISAENNDSGFSLTKE